MSGTAAFYLEQAASCARAAAATGLANQRDTYLRAEAAWQVMADRSQRTLDARLQREAIAPAAGPGGFPGNTEEQPNDQGNQPAFSDRQG